MDNLAGEAGSGTGIVLVSFEGPKLNSAMQFRFKATNNVAEYEALLDSLQLSRKMQVKRSHSSTVTLN